MYTNVRRNVAGLDVSNIKQTQIKGLCVPQTTHIDPGWWRVTDAMHVCIFVIVCHLGVSDMAVNASGTVKVIIVSFTIIFLSIKKMLG